MDELSGSPFPERFPVSLALAAELTGQTPEWIADFIRCGVIPCAISATAPGHPSAVWVAVDDIARLQDGGPGPSAVTPTEDRMLQVCRTIRTLFEATPPQTSAAMAVANGTGLVGRDRQGHFFLHIRAEDLANFAKRTNGHPYAAFMVVVENTLRVSGARRVRGIRGLDDSKPHFGWWYRLPHSLAKPDADLDGWLVDFPQLDAALAETKPDKSRLFTEPAS